MNGNLTAQANQKPSGAEGAAASRAIVTKGKWIKIAAVFDEELVEGDAVEDPEAFVARVKAELPKADLVTFVQKLPNLSPKYDYPIEWDNMAAIPIVSFKDWWESHSWKRRQEFRKASKRGVVVKVATFDDTFVRGIKNIYDESPIRQGKRFWHYGKAVRR